MPLASFIRPNVVGLRPRPVPQPVTTRVIYDKSGSPSPRDATRSRNMMPRRLGIIFSFLVGIFLIQTSAVGQVWQFANGPYVASIDQLGIDPTNPQVIYAAVNEQQVYKTTNRGASWFLIYSSISSGYEFTYVTLNPLNPNAVYAGFVKSADGGLTWETVGLPTYSQIDALVIDRRDTNRLYATMGTGTVFRSSDGGQTWLHKSNGIDTCIVGICGNKALFIVPDTNGIAFTATTQRSQFSKLYKTTNAGENWYTVLSGRDVHRIEPRGSQRGHFWAASRGLYLSTDYGDSWIPFALSGIKTRSVARHPTDSMTMFVGTEAEGILKSTNGGIEWNPINTGLPANTSARFVMDIVIDDQSSNVMLAATAAGVYATTNAGQEWHPSNNGMRSTVITDIALSRSDPQIIYAAGNAGIFRTTDASETWNLQYSAWMTAIEVDPIDVLRVYATYSNPFTDEGFLVLSSDGGFSWMQTTVRSDSYIQSLSLSLRHPEYIYVASWGSPYMWKSTDRGLSWEQFLPPPSARTISSLVVHPDSFQTIYVGTRRGVFRSSNGGTSWINIDFTDFGSDIYLAASETNPAILYAALYGSALYRTSNGGLSWDSISPPPDRRFRTIVVNSSNANDLLVSTFGGVFRTTSCGSDWFDYNQGFPHSFGTDALVIDTLGLGRAYAGMVGVYRRDSLSIVTGVNEHEISNRTSKLNARLAAYPNPSNGGFRITYSIPISEHVVLKVYDMLGREVNEVANRFDQVGSYEFAWDRKNSRGQIVSSGIYLLQMIVGVEMRLVKIVVLQ